MAKNSPLGDLERDVIDGDDTAAVKGLAGIRIGDQGSGRHLMRSPNPWRLPGGIQ